MRQDRWLVLFARLWAVLILAAVALAAAPSQSALAAQEAAQGPTGQSASLASPSATCVILKPDKPNGKDAYLKEENVNENKGGDSELRVKTEAGKLKRSLIAFDLSGLPANAAITSADLSLWVKAVNDGDITINAHQVTRMWDEAQVTWNFADTGSSLLWTTPGGDYDPAVLSTASFTKGVHDYLATWSITAAAQSWILDPASNYGVILEAPVSDPKNETVFSSNDESNVDKRPQLNLCYDLVYPDIQVTKSLVTTGPIYVGQTVTFEITVQNTGQTALAVLPLSDWFDPTVLQLLGAEPVPDVVANGRLEWYNLATQIGSLAASDTFSVLLDFKALKPTSGMALAADVQNAEVTPPEVAGPAAIEALDSCGYPYSSSNPKTNVVFNESLVLRAFSPTDGGTARAGDTLKVWYNDEHALTLGVRRVVVGGIGTDYPVSPLTSNPGHVTDPQVGATALSGDQAGTDLSGRPMWPGLYITDITTDPNNRAGDWQWGGAPVAPHDVFGAWKAAVRTVSTSGSVSVTPDADPAKNNWNLGGGDPPPAGLANEGFGAEVRWTVDRLISEGKLIPGHKYRFQFTVHDGDQNKSGGDVGEACTTISLATAASIGDRVWYDGNADKVQQADESGINGVRVNLYGGACPVTGPSGTPLTSQVTVGDGSYDFGGLAAGAYCVAVDPSTLPAGFGLTTANLPMTVNLATNQDFNTADFGYRAQCTNGTANVATADGVSDVYNSSVPTKINYTCLEVLPGGKFSISKTLNSPGPFFVGQEIAYTIHIANTGNTTLTTVPLQDLYDPTRLTFLGATPASDNNTNDGVLDWSDLTQSGANGFGADLAPGASFNVLVRFQATASTSAAALVTTDAARQDAGLSPDAAATQAASAADVPLADQLQQLGQATSAPAVIDAVDSCGYPYSSATARTSVVFNESEVLRAFSPTDGGIAGPADTIKVWFNDEHALTLGVRQVQVKTASGTTTTNYSVSSMLASPDHIVNPQMGTTVMSGDQSGNDLSDRPMRPSLYITDITSDPNNRSGDWQFGGTSITPNEVFGTWKAAVRFVDNTKNPAVVSITPDADPAKNNWNLAGGDPPPAGAVNQGYGAEARWNVNGLNLLPGRTYRIQVTVHDGDQNKSGGDVGEACTTIQTASPGTIGDRVFQDQDSSGLPDAGAEPGINGVTVNLYQNACPASGLPSGSVYASTTTTGNGTYHFTNLNGGTYCVAVDTSTLPFSPGGWTATTTNPLTVQLASGQIVDTADFGFKQSGTGKIGDRVFYDLDKSGLPDPGTEPGLNGVTVNLYSGACPASGAPLATQVTSGNGGYLFQNLPAGSYCVMVDATTVPSSYALTTGNQPLSVTLGNGQAYLTADFGYQGNCTSGTPNVAATNGIVESSGALLPDQQAVACADVGSKPGAIGDFVWYDADGDGIEDVGEPGVANVTLDLYKDGVKIESTVTDADGGYLFAKLSPGNYVVDVTDLNGVLSGLTHTVAYQSQPDPTGVIVLNAGELYKDADFGYVKTPGSGMAIIGDTVWYDANGDRFQQPEEQGIPGIQVCATAGATQYCMVTDPTGHYLLEVPAGSYTVAPTNPPAGYTATTPVSQAVTVMAGQQYLNADFGYNSPNLGKIGNLVFEDGDQNGVFSGTDTALGGVSVDLIRNTNGNATWDPGEPIVATTTTATSLGANNGNYLFTGVPAGNYLVHVSDTNGVLTYMNKAPLGTPNVDNNNQADPYKVTVSTGGIVLTADFGYTGDGGGTGGPTGIIGNQVWIEKDGNGLFDPANQDFGQPGVTVELQQSGATVASTTTGASGDYLFIGLDAGTYTVQVTDDLGVLGSYRVTKLGPNQGQDNNNELQPYTVNLPAAGKNLTADFGYIQPGAIGDYVWYDTNANGLEDVNEPGIGNVTLRLYRDNGDGVFNTGSDTLVAATVTDKDGGYIFNNLLAGSYWVDPDQTSAALAGLTKTSGPQSQADPFGVITLSQGQIYRDADFGYVSQAAGQAVIGDLVWYDANGDGLYQSNTEVGVPGIQVCATPAGGGGALCATTNDNGWYHIQVSPGSYTVAPTNPPAGYTATTPTSVGPVTVAAGEQYLDADFGYDSPNLATLGGTVWHDTNRDGLLDLGEPGIPSVSVDVIRDTNGNGQWDAGEPIIGTSTTNAGDYQFAGLPPGKYLVVVSDTQKALDDFIVSTLGPNPGQDSNNQAQPYAVSLTAGSANTTADFGYVQSGNNDRLGEIGNQVWYEEDGNGLFNPEGTDVGVAGVNVNLYRSGVFYASTTTGASGDYIFSSLPAGNYTVSVSDSFGILSGLLVTKLGPNPGQDDNNQAQPYGIVLASAALNMTADFGYTRPGAIGDFVWYDVDGDGIEDVGEPGIANVTLDLLRDGIKIASTVTDADGGYLFPKLIPGNYQVDVTDLNHVLTGMTHIIDRQSQPDPTALIKLAAGEVNKDADFGYLKTPSTGKAIIGDFVWYDANGDGLQQPGELGIPGIQVCATPSGGGAGICATTDGNGHYLVEVPAGTYTVAPTAAPNGSSPTTPSSLSVTVSAGQQYLDADFGYAASNLGTVGNLVFKDLNQNGVYEGADAPLGGVSVDLIRDTNGSKTWDLGEPIIGTVTTATSLGANTGNYLFAGVPAGNYLVHVSDTNAVLTDFTKSPVGTPGVDNQNQADPYSITLAAGGSNLTADFGYWQANRPDVGVIGNQVWIEKDGNGLFDLAKGEFGQHGVTLELYRDGVYIAKTTTGASGDYAFVGLPSGSYSVKVTDDLDVLTMYVITTLGPNPGQDNNNQAQPYGVSLAAGGYNLTADFGYLIPSSSIGDTVFYDDNRNGLQDPGGGSGPAEDGISGVLVQLWVDNGGSCNKLQSTTSTDGNGKYVFVNLPPGHYCVIVPETLTDNPSLADLERTAGTNPHEVTLAANQNYLAADFGYAGRGLIRGVVYFDLNGNGIQEPTEPNITGVKICLYADANKDGVPDSPNPLACTTTDNSGVYVFPSLLPGGYAMTETDPQGLTSTTPNTIKTGLVVVQGSGLSDNNNFGDTATSSYSVSKTLVTTGEPFRPNTPITFDIVIRNTGNTYITFLPLKDTYDKNYLQYVNATPASVDNNNDGSINWSDLTVTFGDLAPGATVTVKANFIALQDTSALPGGVTINTAVVQGATADPDGPNGPLGSIVSLQTLTANDSVAVFVPTGVVIESFTATRQAGGVLLAWATANEQAVVGFNVYRETGNGALVQVNDELIVAQNAGAAGAAKYSLQDAVVGQRYVLEVVKTDGATERYKVRQIER